MNDEPTRSLLPAILPILDRKAYAAPSVFTAENLLREARQQKRLPDGPVPTVCVLDPDGDLLDYLHATGRAERHAAWACYHTELFVAEDDNLRHHRPRGGRVVRRAGGRGAVCMRLSASPRRVRSRHLGRRM